LFAFSQLRRKNLESYFSIEFGIFGKIDVAHPTGADLLQDSVVGEGASDHRRFPVRREYFSDVGK
jgi:hypothetical protein